MTERGKSAPQDDSISPLVIPRALHCHSEHPPIVTLSAAKNLPSRLSVILSEARKLPAVSLLSRPWLPFLLIFILIYIYCL